MAYCLAAVVRAEYGDVVAAVVDCKKLYENLLRAYCRMYECGCFINTDV